MNYGILEAYIISFMCGGFCYLIMKITGFWNLKF